MKILHLLYESKGDYFGIGGVGIRAYEIYRYLKERHDITLVCKKYPGAKDREIEGLRHIFVGTESKSLTRTLLSYAYHSVRFVKEHGKEFDIIIEDFSPAIPTFLHAFTKKSVILQIQGYTGKHYFRKYNPAYASILYMMEHLRPMFYDNFILINLQTAKKLLLGSGKHIMHLQNGISHEVMNAVSYEDEYILYLGRIDIYGKGLDILINAYKEFYQSFPGIRLVIAGDGRDREKFRAELTKLPENVRENIELLGWVSGDKKMEVIRKALYVVLPSRHEVQSIVVFEAMACEKAVIVSGIPEFTFIVTNGAGQSFKSGDALSLAQSMKDMMTNDERKEMGKRGRNLVKDYTWDKIALKFEKCLFNVLDRY